MSELTVKAVLCDMDGTLVDSTAMVEQMWTEFADAHDVSATEVIDFAHGRPSRATIHRFLDNEDEIARWIEHIHHLEAHRFTGVVEIPGAVAFTHALPPARWAVVTSALAGPARERMASIGIAVPNTLIGADNVHQGKPHPEGYLAAASALGVDPRECVVFEDTPAGVEAGRAAGCEVVVVGQPTVAARYGCNGVPDLTTVSVEATADGVRLTF